MVVEIVDIHGVAVFEAKRHSPVPRNGYGVVSPHAALERMQPKAGNIHPFRACAPVQGGQNSEEFPDVLLCNLRRTPLLVEFFQAAMPERPDHDVTVWCVSTIVKSISATERRGPASQFRFPS